MRLRPTKEKRFLLEERNERLGTMMLRKLESTLRLEMELYLGLRHSMVATHNLMMLREVLLNEIGISNPERGPRSFTPRHVTSSPHSRADEDISFS